MCLRVFGLGQCVVAADPFAVVGGMVAELVKESFVGSIVFRRRWWRNTRRVCVRDRIAHMCVLCVFSVCCVCLVCFVCFVWFGVFGAPRLVREEGRRPWTMCGDLGCFIGRPQLEEVGGGGERVLHMCPQCVLRMACANDTEFGSVMFALFLFSLFAFVV